MTGEGTQAQSKAIAADSHATSNPYKTRKEIEFIASSARYECFMNFIRDYLLT